jgi:hypothetical protein
VSRRQPLTGAFGTLGELGTFYYHHITTAKAGWSS